MLNYVERLPCLLICSRMSRLNSPTISHDRDAIVAGSKFSNDREEAVRLCLDGLFNPSDTHTLSDTHTCVCVWG